MGFNVFVLLSKQSLLTSRVVCDKCPQLAIFSLKLYSCPLVSMVGLDLASLPPQIHSEDAHVSYKNHVVVSYGLCTCSCIPQVISILAMIPNTM